jgi:hypothetical protein
MSNLRWAPTETKLVNGRWQPDYDNVPGFTPSMWREQSRGRTNSEWRSYTFGGSDVVARVCLSHTFSSHDGAPQALLIDRIEVRADRRREGIGADVVNDLVYEHHPMEIYAGPTQSSLRWWDDRMRWPRCDCNDCDGRSSGLVVLRP